MILLLDGELHKCTATFFSLTFLNWVLMSYPAMMAVPLVIEMSPVSILNVVVFPAPRENDDEWTVQCSSYLRIIHHLSSHNPLDSLV